MVNLEKMRNEIEEIVTREDVKYVIGYERGTYGWRISPSFATTPEDVKKLTFSPLCVNNLAVYLAMENRLPLPESKAEKDKKVGVVVKGCDSRAVALLLQEKAISRENVIIIGVPCGGVIEPAKMQKRFGDVLSHVSVAEQGDTYVVSFDDTQTEVPKVELLPNVCKTCQYQNPVLYDVLAGDLIETQQEESYAGVTALEEKVIEERWDYWKTMFDRCIRCYACRNVCPVCNCIECLTDKLQPVWIRRSVNTSENTAYHVMRAFHMAGRCISCGMCEKACPVDIPLTTLYKKVEKDVLELFDYTAGIDANAEPLLSMYKTDDSDNGIL